jgi:hypothetical protein
MTETLKLIECLSCKKEISILASTCPGCGAPNDWIHPKIKELVDSDDGILPLKWTYTYSGTKVSGQTEKKTPVWVWVFHIFMISFLALFCYGIFGMSMIWLWMYVVFSWIINAMFGVKKEFKANLQTGTWVSTDDKFWKPVREMLFSAEHP